MTYPMCYITAENKPYKENSRSRHKHYQYDLALKSSSDSVGLDWQDQHTPTESELIYWYAEWCL